MIQVATENESIQVAHQDHGVPSLCHTSAASTSAPRQSPEMSFATLFISLVRTRSVLPSISRITFSNFNVVKGPSSVKKISPLPVT